MSKAFRVGAFIVATLSILAAGVFLIGSKQFLFSSTYRVRAEFPNVAGLTQGADVLVGGTRQGTVNHIELPKRPDGKVIDAVNEDAVQLVQLRINIVRHRDVDEEHGTVAALAQES